MQWQIAFLIKKKINIHKPLSNKGLRACPGAPLGGSAPQPFRVVGVRCCLALLQSRLDEHLIELTEHLDLRSLQVKLFLDLLVGRTTLDRVNALAL